MKISSRVSWRTRNGKTGSYFRSEIAEGLEPALRKMDIQRFVITVDDRQSDFSARYFEGENEKEVDVEIGLPVLHWEIGSLSACLFHLLGHHAAFWKVEEFDSALEEIADEKEVDVEELFSHLFSFYWTGMEAVTAYLGYLRKVSFAPCLIFGSHSDRNAEEKALEEALRRGIRLPEALVP